jgi:hypothetical protein
MVEAFYAEVAEHTVRRLRRPVDATCNTVLHLLQKSPCRHVNYREIHEAGWLDSTYVVRPLTVRRVLLRDVARVCPYSLDQEVVSADKQWETQVTYRVVMSLDVPLSYKGVANTRWYVQQEEADESSVVVWPDEISP